MYDNFVAGHRSAVKDAALVEGDIRDTSRVRDAIRRHEVTAVMHFAAFASVGDSVRDPLTYYRNNVEGTLSVLGAMAAESVRHFVFSSTAAVYGEPLEVPITEAHATRPINPYGETKLAIERALPHLERAHGISTTCLRYFNAAGADPDGELGEDHRPEQHLIPRALGAVLGGEPLMVFGNDYPTPDGTCLRDYVHVADLADAHVLALSMLEETRKSATYNLGNGRPFSVAEVISTVQAVTGRPVPWHLAPRRDGDPAVLYASSEKIKAELRWHPRLPALATIVETAWRWQRAHPHGYESR